MKNTSSQKKGWDKFYYCIEKMAEWFNSDFDVFNYSQRVKLFLIVFF